MSFKGIEDDAINDFLARMSKTYEGGGYLDYSFHRDIHDERRSYIEMDYFNGGFDEEPEWDNKHYGSNSKFSKWVQKMIRGENNGR